MVYGCMRHIFRLFRLIKMYVQLQLPSSGSTSFFELHFKMSNVFFLSLLYHHQAMKCTELISQNERDYGSISVDISKSDINTSSRYGSLKEPFVVLRTFDYARDDDRRSLILCNSAFNDANYVMIDTLFQCLFTILPTEEIQNKLMETSIFRKYSINKSEILHNRKILRSLEQSRFKFIRGLDRQRRPFIFFSLSSNIPSLFKHAWSRYLGRIDIIITFNESGMISPNQQGFTIDDFIYLLEYDEVFTAFGTNKTKKYIHVSDQLAEQRFLINVRSGIKSGIAILIVASQCTFCLLHSNTNPSMFYALSVSMSAFLGGGCVMFMCCGLILYCGTSDSAYAALCSLVSASIVSVLSMNVFFGLAIEYPAFNGIASGLCLCFIWLLLTFYCEQCGAL